MKPGDWKLVTDMSELRVGMTVKVEPCMYCTVRHVMVVAGRGVDDRGVPGFALTPPPHCVQGSGVFADDTLTWRGVAIGDGIYDYEQNFFRLITGNDDEAEQKVGRSMENPRLIAVARSAVGEVKRRLAAGGGER